MTLRRLVLLRHGQSEFNTVQRMQGHLDPALTALGVAQAREAAPLVCQLKPERLISSDLARARCTAEEVGAVCGLPVEVDPRMRETNLGRWQGKTVDEIEADLPGAVAAWREAPTWAPPGGESRIEVVARALPVVTELDAEFADVASGVTVLLCAHSGVISGLTAALLGLPVPTWPSISGLGNCRWTNLTRRNGASRWRLAGHNLGPLE